MGFDDEVNGLSDVQMKVFGGRPGEADEEGFHRFHTQEERAA